MGEETKIAWCDSTWNWIIGCTKVSPGCKFCYAENSPPARLGGIKWGDQGERKISSDATFNAPLKWNKKPWMCDICGTPSPEPRCGTAGCYCGEWHRRRVFSLSLGDWLDPKIPIEVLARALDIIRRCPDLDFLLCTKRAELWAERIKTVIYYAEDKNTNLLPWVNAWWTNKPPRNVWVITSVEDQERANERIPHLLKIPALVRGLSCEPLLGPLDLRLARTKFPVPLKQNLDGTKHVIDWVIVGGESGKNARPCNIEWIRGIKDQCKAAGVPCFVKQLGAKPAAILGPVSGEPGRVGDTITLPMKHPKGGDPEKWPEDLRVQQFPRP